MSETIIDLISQEKNGGVVLLLRQSEPWDKQETLITFQKQLNGYIDVITHGAIYEKYPDLKQHPIRIRLLCCHEPPPNVKQKLDRVNQTLVELGIGFEIVQMKIETERRDKIKEGLTSFFRKILGKRLIVN